MIRPPAALTLLRTCVRSSRCSVFSHAMTLSSVLKGLLHKDKNQQQQPSPSSSKSQPAPSNPPPTAPAAPHPSISQPEPAHLPPATQQDNHQQMQSSSTANGGSGTTSGKQAEAAEVVRREEAAKAKRDANVMEGLPQGLELGRKMGDGAFSNVFEATLRPSPAQLAVDPTLGKSIKVAVKCVRKFELNSSQVRRTVLSSLSLFVRASQGLAISQRHSRSSNRNCLLVAHDPLKEAQASL